MDWPLTSPKRPNEIMMEEKQVQTEFLEHNYRGFNPGVCFRWYISMSVPSCEGKVHGT